jgi:hypothetical protein
MPPVFPMTEYSMYGAVPLRAIKQALLNLKATGRLHKAKIVGTSHCSFAQPRFRQKRRNESCSSTRLFGLNSDRGLFDGATWLAS